MKKNDILKIVALCGMASSAVGLFMNSVGVFFTPIANELGKSQGEVSMFSTILTFAIAIGSIIIPKIINTANYRKIYLISLLVSVAGVLGLSMSHSLVMLYGSSLLVGFGCCAYSVIMISLLISNSFDSNIGSITGLVFSFSGIAGAVLAPTFAAIINSAGWRTAFMVMAVFDVVFNIPGLICRFTFKETNDDGSKEKFNFFSLKFISCFMVLTLMQFILGLPQHFNNFAITRNLSSVGPLMVSACMIGNIVSKLIAGRLVDVIGNMKAFLIMCCAVVIGCILLLVGKNATVLLVGAALLGCVYSTTAVTIPLLIRETFGVDKYKVTYPVIAFGGNVTNALSLSVYGYMYDFTSSYNLAIIVVMAVCILSYLSAVVTRKLVK